MNKFTPNALHKVPIILNLKVRLLSLTRETFPYIDRAKADGARINIFETHFHADFVSGHLDLAKSTEAKIVFGPEANPSFEFISANDGGISNWRSYDHRNSYARTYHGIYMLFAEGFKRKANSFIYWRYFIYW